MGVTFFCHLFYHVHWNVQANIKNLCAQNNISKKNVKSEYLNHLYFGPKFIFGGTSLERFSQSFFYFIFRGSTMLTNIFTQSPIKKNFLRACELVNSFLIKISITDRAFCKNSKQLIFKDMNTNTKKMKFSIKGLF